jgi:energy-coupling factor transporter transmembrane protein EcfT
LTGLATPAADPRLALAVALALMVAALGAPRAGAALWLAACALAALLATSGWRSAPWRTLATAWALGAAAALLRALLSCEAPLVPVHAFGHALPLSGPGLGQGGLLLSRVLATTLAAAWLAARTPIRDLAAGLAWARCPAALIDLLLLAARYRHVLGESLAILRCAQTMRLGYVGARRSFRSAAALAGALACRAVDQSAATAEAMRLRGDSGAAGLRLSRSSARANLLLAGRGALALGGAALLSRAPW